MRHSALPLVSSQWEMKFVPNFSFSKNTYVSNCTEDYRYTFNGKETDAETGLQDYGMRIYNERLGRFITVDPITNKYPFLTPYQFASNCPTKGVDLDGLEYAGNPWDYMVYGFYQYETAFCELFSGSASGTAGTTNTTTTSTTCGDGSSFSSSVAVTQSSSVTLSFDPGAAMRNQNIDDLFEVSYSSTNSTTTSNAVTTTDQAASASPSPPAAPVAGGMPTGTYSIKQTDATTVNDDGSSSSTQTNTATVPVAIAGRKADLSVSTSTTNSSNGSQTQSVSVGLGTGVSVGSASTGTAGVSGSVAVSGSQTTTAAGVSNFSASITGSLTASVTTPAVSTTFQSANGTKTTVTNTTTYFVTGSVTGKIEAPPTPK